MTEDLRQNVEAMIKTFATDLGLPKVDVDKLIDMHKKNLDVLVQTANAASTSVMETANKQRQSFEAAMNDALAMASALKPGGDPKALVSQQQAVVGQAVENAVGSTIAVAEQVQKLNGEVFKLVADRLSGSVSELRASFETPVGKPQS